jgi:hypothetical protein
MQSTYKNKAMKQSMKKYKPLNSAKQQPPALIKNKRIQVLNTIYMEHQKTTRTRILKLASKG